MRSVSDAFKNSSLGGEVLTLAQLWKITRTDGEIFGFTNHDLDIIYDGVTYRSAKGYLPSAASHTGNLAVDNLDVVTMLSSGFFTEEDIVAGVWDNAVVDLYMIDYDHTDRGVMILASGWRTGEFKIGDNEFSAELRSKTQRLQQTIVELTSPECRASLGDSRCGVSLQPDEWEANTAYSIGDIVRATTYDARRYVCVDVDSTLFSGAVEPTWDTTVGNETVDGGITWLCYDLLEVDPWQPNEFVDIGAIRRATIAGEESGESSAADISTDHRQYVAVDLGSSATTGPTEPDWDTTIGNETIDNDVTWKCISAWHKESVVTGVTDRRQFEAVSLADEDDSYNYGIILWLTGENAGYEMEVKDWDLDTHNFVLFEKMPFTINIGDTFAASMGCDRRYITCRDRFGNIENFRGEPHLPGSDEVFRYTT